MVRREITLDTSHRQARPPTFLRPRVLLRRVQRMNSGEDVTCCALLEQSDADHGPEIALLATLLGVTGNIGFPFR